MLKFPFETVILFHLKMRCGSDWALAQVITHLALLFDFIMSEILPFIFRAVKPWFWIGLPGSTVDLEHSTGQTFHDMQQIHIKIDVMKKSLTL